MLIIGCDFHTRYQQIAMTREEIHSPPDEPQGILGQPLANKEVPNRCVGIQYRAHQKISRGKLPPHFTAGLGDVLLGEVYVEVFEEAFQTAQLARGTVVCLKRVNKIEDFLLLLRRQRAELFDDFFFYWSWTACRGGLSALYATVHPLWGH